MDLRLKLWLSGFDKTGFHIFRYLPFFHVFLHYHIIDSLHITLLAFEKIKIKFFKSWNV